MRQTLRTTIVLLATTAAMWSAAADATAQTLDPAVAESEIRQFIEDWQKASKNSDREWYDRHYADSFLKTGRDGRVVDKQQEIPSPGAAPIEGWTSSVDNLKIRIFGDVAVLTYGVAVSGRSEGQSFSIRARATTVLVKRGGMWQVHVHHATDIAS